MRTSNRLTRCKKKASMNSVWERTNRLNWGRLGRVGKASMRLV